VTQLAPNMSIREVSHCEGASLVAGEGGGTRRRGSDTRISVSGQLALRRMVLLVRSR